MVTPIALADVTATLGLKRGQLISLVGGGGKTTTLFALGEQLDGTTVLTTTTKMGSEQTGDLPVLIDPTDAVVASTVLQHRVALAWKVADDRRATGVSARTCDRWFDGLDAVDNVVVEADGSRKRPFKAPAAYEPVVPTSTTLLIACVGAEAIGLPIAACCHRPELVAELVGCAIGEPLTASRAATVLLSSRGSRKGLPPDARFVVMVHRVDPHTAPAVSELASIIDGQVEVVAVAPLDLRSPGAEAARVRRTSPDTLTG